jgi:hypothetical protein
VTPLIATPRTRRSARWVPCRPRFSSGRIFFLWSMLTSGYLPIIGQRYGASAMVLDQRVFVSFNPFNIYVTQADVKPGCVLRASNVGQILQSRGLLTEDEVRRAARRSRGNRSTRSSRLSWWLTRPLVTHCRVCQVQSCKNAANTWAYVGELSDAPQLSCVYQSDDAQNEFLSNPKVRPGARKDRRSRRSLPDSELSRLGRLAWGRMCTTIPAR